MQREMDAGGGHRRKSKRKEVSTQHLLQQTAARQLDPVDPHYVLRDFQPDITPVRNDFCGSSFDTSHRKPTDRSGGYDYEFVDCPSDELICSICLSVLRDPNLTSCCGNHFCQSCICRIKSEQNPCPLCQEQCYTVMLDKFFIRRVKELKIKCPSSSRGCEWVSELGNLQKHLDVSCGFVDVSCDYCQSEGILRHSLADHKKRICPLRPYSCEYCGLRGTWESITHVHLSVCEKYPMECPNKCGIGGVQRIDFEKHVREECPLGEVSCTFEYAGCRVRLPRNDIDEHLSEKVSSHLAMVVRNFRQKLAERDEVIDELRMNVESQKKEIAALTASAESLTRKVQSQRKDISALIRNFESQGKDVSALTVNFHSQGKDISKLRGNIQSLYRRTDDLKMGAESHTREQNRQIEKLETTIQFYSREQSKQIEELEEEIDELEAAVQFHTTEQNIQTPELEETQTRPIENETVDRKSVFQLLKDIASTNRDICVSDTRVSRLEMAIRCIVVLVGAILGGIVGGAIFEGIVVGAIVGLQIGMLVFALATRKPESAASVLLKITEEKRLAMATSAIEVANEWELDIVERPLAILNDPRQARPFLVAVLRTQYTEVVS